MKSKAIPFEMREILKKDSHAAKFRTEESLVQGFLAFQRKTMPKAIKFVREFDGGLGLADIVFYSRNANAKRDLTKLAEINPRLAVLLDVEIAASISTLEDLRSLLGTSMASARVVANQLKRAGLADQTEAHPLRIKGVQKAPFTSIVSIEAKLSDWKRGLNQAFRYTQFSEEAWLLLDAKTSASALRNVASFKRTGVGLASFSTKGELFIHVVAKNQPPNSRNKAWRAQAVLARL